MPETTFIQFLGLVAWNLLQAGLCYVVFKVLCVIAQFIDDIIARKAG